MGGAAGCFQPTGTSRLQPDDSHRPDKPGSCAIEALQPWNGVVFTIKTHPLPDPGKLISGGHSGSFPFSLTGFHTKPVAAFISLQVLLFEMKKQKFNNADKKQ